jgi:hypothetical protein
MEDREAAPLPVLGSLKTSFVMEEALQLLPSAHARLTMH